ncbi:MAG: hypothetical protein NXI24_13395 [bacterium]|nr:hypothetical protein [bacterium]
MERRRPTLIAALFLSITLAATGVPADSILLKNGREIEGAIVGQSRQAIQIRNARTNKVESVPKQQIRRVRYGPVREAPQKSKEPRRPPAETTKPENSPAADSQTPDPKAAESNAPAEKSSDSPAPESKPPASKATETKTPSRQTASPDAQADAAPTDTGSGALWRSAIFPGWGQLHQERRSAGLAFGFAGLASLLHLQNSFAHFRAAGDEELQLSRLLFGAGAGLGSPATAGAGLALADAARNDRAAARERLQLANLIFAGVYILNFLDVFPGLAASRTNAGEPSGAGGARAATGFALSFGGAPGRRQPGRSLTATAGRGDPSRALMNDAGVFLQYSFAIE